MTKPTEPCVDNIASPNKVYDQSIATDADTTQSDDSESDKTDTTFSDENQDITPLPTGGFAAYDIYKLITTANDETV